jgi:hypothetical protein
MGWDIVKCLLEFFKSLFTADKPRTNTISHPDSEVEVTDGKMDDERLEDLGL